ncbi:hypothetical protein ACIPXV_02795 [Streptomyces libani]|uniref:hypothetical protein n=1 Tax=Streptomyces nigrescens TaxID=1920 RepID=UPI0038210643
MGGPLKKYRVTSASGVQSVMKLNDDDAKARGLSAGDLVDAPERDAEPEAEGSAETGDKAAAKAAPPAPNKARTSSANKGRGARGGD